ncbi:hypothetical protein [Streptomyces xanthii]|uniref:Repetin n=1 Tax=Streptomyces xanthii TaxID=2768069 RepID=A0A7H1BF76_9ACTN|nr:hypothetical protein [Streptomyces xanthii]QNS07381.1 hypothetical protein IAG42_29805 [Streptomyces xanthii]
MARIRILVATAAALTVAVAGTAAAGTGSAGGGHGRPAQPREAAALTGTAQLWRPPSAHEDITFTFDAHLAAKDNMAPEKAYGTFFFSHYKDGKGAWAKGRIDCLMTGGKTAVMTGVVTESDSPHLGKRVGISVTDDGREDRLGYTWSNPDTGVLEVPRCMSAPPFEVVKKGTGDFEVLPWKPEYRTD